VYTTSVAAEAALLRGEVFIGVESMIPTSRCGLARTARYSPREIFSFFALQARSVVDFPRPLYARATTLSWSFVHRVTSGG
jgi:hypothetical protein